MLSGVLPDRYNTTNLRRLVRDPTLLAEELGNVRRSAARVLNNVRFRATHGDPFDVMAEDWDVLVLLDACRADFYREETPFSGDVETRLSRGSGTPEFLRENFRDQTFHDTFYVSSNPYVPTLQPDSFHAILPLLDEWDESRGTVLPDTLTESAVEAAAEFPDKRLVVHYMQPHTPHLGPTADRIRERVGLRGWDRYHVHDGQSKVNAGRSIWDLVQDGTVAHETMLQSYRESLQVGLESVERLVSAVDGKVVVSADHGEMLGERLVPFGPREFGHTTGLLTEPLRIVPWQVVQTGPRRDVVSDPPVESETLTEEETEQRLRALGYVE